MHGKKLQIPEWLMERIIRFGLLMATIALFVYCSTFFFEDAIIVSNNVDGRALPIYCVDTPEKKVALSFDAAWGNEDTATILQILEDHDVNVTFFMTGGWVVEWAYRKSFLCHLCDNSQIRTYCFSENQDGCQDGFHIL